MKVFRFVSGTAAALALVTGLAAAQPAAAKDRLSPGAAAAIGVLGGLAIGGAIAASQAPVYAAPAPVYVAPPPPPPLPRVQRHVETETVYYSRPAPPPPVVVERCTTERFRDWIPGYGWEYRTRRTCSH